MKLKGPPSLARRVKYRIWALPRTLREFDQAVLLLGTMRRIGWAQSVRRGKPVDSQDEPIPWLTYPAIFWLDLVLNGEEAVLEVGAGNSTLWLARKAKLVTSIEHDAAWYEHLRSLAPPNVNLQFRPCSGDLVQTRLDDPYVDAIRGVPDASLDLALIDGMARVTCLLVALPKLKEDGAVILDDAHRTEYQVLHEVLATRGYSRIDFNGPVPGASNFGTTSVFSQALERWVPSEAPIPWGYTIDDFWPPKRRRRRDDSS